MRLLLLLACISPSARAPAPPPHVDAAALPWISDPLRDFRELGGIRPEHVLFDPLPPICASGIDPLENHTEQCPRNSIFFNNPAAYGRMLSCLFVRPIVID